MAENSDRSRLVLAEHSTDEVFQSISTSTSQEEIIPEPFSTQAADIDTSSISFPGNVHVDAEGEVYTITRGGSLHMSGDHGSDRHTPWHYASQQSMGDFATTPSMEEYAQFIGLGKIISR